MAGVPLAWERVLWRGRRWRERYLLTDLRLVRVRGGTVDELPLTEIGDIHRRESTVDAIAGTSTIVVHPRQKGREPLVLRRVRRGAQLAALIELLSGQPHATVDLDAARAALEWEPSARAAGVREGLAAAAVIACAAFAVSAWVHGHTVEPSYSAGDPIYPDGRKASPDAITLFMEQDVMPWARVALAPLKGGADKVTCATCHGRDARSRGWRMPAVASLPEPDVRQKGWELYGGVLDAQMRNAIYGYLAESDNQRKAGYMRDTVMPGMARLLHRPAYDFTRTYEYNRSRLAFGCYHCHRVK